MNDPRNARSRGLPAAGALLAALVLAAAPAAAQGLGLGVKGGTTGLGLDLTVGLTPALNVRAGGAFFSYSREFTRENVTYDGRAKLSTGMALVDIHPGGREFRVSAGAYYNGTRVEGESVGGTVELNGVVYDVNAVGRVSGEAKGKRLCPYLGIGFGNAAREGARVRLALDLGVYYSGSPEVSLTATPVNPALVPPDFERNLEAERRRVEDDVSSYRFYPVVSLGISFRL